jgi:hypothetical protein
MGLVKHKENITMSTSKKPTNEVSTTETEEVDKFADARELAQKNHDAEQARNAEAKAEAEAADDGAKTEIKAQPKKTASKNPEQVKSSSEFPEAPVETPVDEPVKE